MPGRPSPVNAFQSRYVLAGETAAPLHVSAPDVCTSTTAVASARPALTLQCAEPFAVSAAGAVLRAAVPKRRGTVELPDPLALGNALGLPPALTPHELAAQWIAHVGGPLTA